MELAALEAPRKSARGREGGEAEIVEKYGGRKKRKRCEERRKIMHFFLWHRCMKANVPTEGTNLWLFIQNL